MQNFLNLVFPPTCIFCGNYGTYFCEACLKDCRRLRRNFSLTSPASSRPVDVFCYFVYEKKIRDCIRHSKFSKKQFVVLKEATKYVLSDMLSRRIAFPPGFIVPIPLSAAKKKYRGFNQADLIAQMFAKAYGYSDQYSILTRQKDTVSQYRLNKEKRLENIKGAFTTSVPVKNLSFILVDDICTTGATLIEAAETLYEAGAKSVRCFTLSMRL